MKKKVVIQNLTESYRKEFIVAKDEHLILFLIVLSSGNYFVKVKLDMIGTQADIYGLVIGKNSMEVKLNTYQQHLASDTISNLLVKSIIADQAKFFYEGFIRVEKNAQKTNAYQRNENLLLSDGSSAESKPALEILANDVRCTHSATVTKPDVEQLFYLESRGIGPKIGRQMITEGFISVILDLISDKDTVDKLKDQVRQLFTGEVI